MKRRQRRLRHDAAGQADRLRGDAAVLIGRQIIRLDRRRVGRIARAQPHMAAAGRPQIGDAGGEGGKGVQRLAEPVERQRLDVKLQIGAFLVGVGAGEQAELRRRHGQRPAPEQRIFREHAGKAERRVIALVERAMPSTL